MSNVDVMLGTVHHVDSNTTSKIHEKQEGTLSVKQSVTPAKQDQATLSVKQYVTPAKQDQVTLSVKQSVTPTKQDQVTLSVKQSVTQNTVNDKESFTRTPTNTTYNKKKIRQSPMISPITQLKGGIKKPQLHKRKFFFQLSTDEKEKTGMEIELCNTLPDLDDENEDKVCVELYDTLDTLPDFLCLCKIINRQTDTKDKKQTLNQKYRKLIFLKVILFFFSQSLTAHEEI